jgi:glycosyltransferase involved in cell wall biosynthesis
MKVLLIHSYYLIRGGEDFVFEQEQKLIGESEQVRALAFVNRPGMRGALQFFLSIWNIGAARKLKRAIREFRPDVIHCHNLHFGIGPLAVRVANKMGIPVVMTLHNYRLICPSATLLLNEAIFTESVHSAFPWKAIRQKAYRNSVVLTFWLAFINWFHKRIGTWKKVDRFIVLTEFARSVFADASLGIPAQKIVIKANFADPVVTTDPAPRQKQFLFVGRLSGEKGVPLLLKAFSQSRHKLHIAGEGPLKEMVEEAAGRYANITYLGPLTKPAVLEAMSAATALIFPSIWFEGLPLTIIEAFASGTPVIASNLGAMASIVVDGYNGLHFEAGNASALLGQLERWERGTTEEMAIYSRNALATYGANYTAGKNRENIMAIYHELSLGVQRQLNNDLSKSIG